MRTCPKCHQEKPIEAFCERRPGVCKACRAEQHRKWMAAHPEAGRRVAPRECSVCGERKPASEFVRDQYRNRCKACHRKARAAYRATHPEKVREQRRRSAWKWRDIHPAEFLLWRVRLRAQRDGIEFNLEPGDIAIPNLCPALGIPLKPSIGKGRGPADDSPSVDRTDPKLGYVRGNVVVISQKANRIKTDASVDEIEAVARWLRSIEGQPRDRISHRE